MFFYIQKRISFFIFLGLFLAIPGFHALHYDGPPTEHSSIHVRCLLSMFPSRQKKEFLFFFHFFLRFSFLPYREFTHQLLHYSGPPTEQSSIHVLMPSVSSKIGIFIFLIFSPVEFLAIPRLHPPTSCCTMVARGQKQSSIHVLMPSICVSELVKRGRISIFIFFRVEFLAIPGHHPPTSCCTMVARRRNNRPFMFDAFYLCFRLVPCVPTRHHIDRDCLLHQTLKPDSSLLSITLQYGWFVLGCDYDDGCSCDYDDDRVAFFSRFLARRGLRRKPIASSSGRNPRFFSLFRKTARLTRENAIFFVCDRRERKKNSRVHVRTYSDLYYMRIDGSRQRYGCSRRLKLHYS